MTTICTWPVREVMCRRGWNQSCPQFYQVCRSTGANLHCGGNIILWIWKGKRAHWNAPIWLLAWSESMYHSDEQYAGYFLSVRDYVKYPSIRVVGLWWNHDHRARLFDGMKKESGVMGRTSREYQISTIYRLGRCGIMILFHRFIGWCQCIDFSRWYELWWGLSPLFFLGN